LKDSNAVSNPAIKSDFLICEVESEEGLHELKLLLKEPFLATIKDIFLIDSSDYCEGRPQECAALRVQIQNICDRSLTNFYSAW